MKEKNASAPFLNIGTSSFLVVFLVLCLVTFAILSLSTSRSDHSLAEKAAERKTLYYDALSRSEEKLGTLDDSLADAYSASSGFSEYLSNLGTALKGSGFTMSSEDGRTVLVSFDVEMSDRQALSCVLRLNDPWSGNANDFYTIESRRVTDTVSWEGDDSVTLISPFSLE